MSASVNVLSGDKAVLTRSSRLLRKLDDWDNSSFYFSNECSLRAWDAKKLTLLVTDLLRAAERTVPEHVNRPAFASLIASLKRAERNWSGCTEFTAPIGVDETLAHLRCHLTRRKAKVEIGQVNRQLLGVSVRDSRLDNAYNLIVNYHELGLEQLVLHLLPTAQGGCDMLANIRKKDSITPMKDENSWPLKVTVDLKSGDRAGKLAKAAGTLGTALNRWSDGQKPPKPRWKKQQMLNSRR
jgi:hypothetical protein